MQPGPGMGIPSAHSDPMTNFYQHSPMQHVSQPVHAHLSGSVIQSPPPINIIEQRILEINRRLTQKPEYADDWWWNQFTLEFFEDTAAIIVSYYTEDGEKHNTISRAMIPRYFSSMYEACITEMSYCLRHPREYMGPGGLTLECENAVVETQYLQPSFARVLAEVRLTVSLGFEEHRIQTWNQYHIRHKEYIPRDILVINRQDPLSVESLCQNVTHYGLSSHTLNFLSVSAVSEPVHNDMKTNGYNLGPYSDMKWHPNFSQPQIMSSRMSHHASPHSPHISDFTPPPLHPHLPPGQEFLHKPEQNTPTKQSTTPKKSKRGRKSSTNKEPANKISKFTPASPALSHTPSVLTPNPATDVMVVGEPILMGGEIEGLDERMITRLENNNLDNLTNGKSHHNQELTPESTNAAGCHEDMNLTAALEALDQTIEPSRSPPKLTCT